MSYSLDEEKPLKPLASIDLSDAYCTAPVAVEHRKYLHFWAKSLVSIHMFTKWFSPYP